MTDRLTIRDEKDNGVLAFDLKEILSALPPIRTALNWRLLDLDGQGKPTSRLNWLDLEEQVDKAPEGIPYGWIELLALASDIFQSYDLTLIGTRDSSLQCQFPVDLTKLRNFVLIEAVDSSYWTVTSDFPEVIQTVGSKFHDIGLERNVA